jgi:hypothetical protein
VQKVTASNMKNSTDGENSGTFCFGGIQLISTSHFHPIVSTRDGDVDVANNYNDAGSVMSESSRKSTSTSTITKSYAAKKVASSPLASLIHPMNRELFGMSKTPDMKVDTSNDGNNDSSHHRRSLFSASSIRSIDTTNISAPEQRMRNDDYNIISPLMRSPTRCSPMTPASMDMSSSPHLNTEKYTIVGKSPTSESRSRLASSFRSSSMQQQDSGDRTKGRVTYNLSSGKKSMSKEERVRVQSLLPKRPILTAEDCASYQNERKERDDDEDKSPTFQLNESKQRLSQLSSPMSISSGSIKHRGQQNQTIAILLIEPQLKIFEVVFLDDLNLREATVGDALAKARANAIDPTLSEQKYNSLCNENQELAAPMLPVDFLLSNISDRAKTEKSNNIDMGNSDNTTNNGSIHGATLLVAVPVGSTATEMQSIKTILWKNPKTARWWDQQDPLRPTRQLTTISTSIKNEVDYNATQ